jgi:hypothetical protein
MSIDAVSKLKPDASLVFGAISKAENGSIENVSAFFHVSSHAVVGRLACLSVAPDFMNFNVTPPPE